MIARPRKPSDEEVERLRSEGWSVAVHNDYRANGQRMTFWLFTHPSGRWIKGEGSTDAEAVQAAIAALSPPADLEARIADLETQNKGTESLLCDAQAEVERMREALAYAQPYLEALASLVKTDYERATTMSAVNKVAASLRSLQTK